MKNEKKSKIAKEVKGALKIHVPKDNESLRHLQDFVQDMSTKGLLKKREYNLPLADTIGKTIFQNKPE